MPHPAGIAKTYLRHRFRIEVARAQARAPVAGFQEALSVSVERAPPVGHPAEQCLAFHALDSSLPGLTLACEPPCVALSTVTLFSLPLLHPPRIVFDSRAPPALS